MKVAEHNRRAWDRESQNRNPATLPYRDEVFASAKLGQFALTLTGQKIVPVDWLGELRGKRVLCVALGGGQQVPLLAAAGADVLSIENSPSQLQADKEVAVRHGLSIETHLGDMQDLSEFISRDFDMAVLGLGLQFVEEPQPVWEGIAKSLRPGGTFLAAIVNPMQYMFEWPAYSKGIFKLKFPLPYSDTRSLTDAERMARFGTDDPLEFGHTFEQTLGGLTQAGFSIDGWMEDFAETEPLSRFIATYFVLRARRE